MTLQTLFGNKADIAIERLRQFEPPEGFWIADSYGKDSCVILDLVKKSGCKFESVHNLTTCDPPALIRFGRKFHTETRISIPEKSMWQLISEKGFLPTRRFRYCCSVLKERGGSGRIVVTGVRKSESPRRKRFGLIEQCFNDPNKRLLHPIIDWEDEDVWEYIKTNNVPYCELYDEGFKRLGCVGCPMSYNQRKELERWPIIANAYKRACDRAVRKRLEAGKGRFKTGKEMFDWWISGCGPEECDEDQGRFFFE